MSEFKILTDLLAWLRGAPTGTQLDAATMAEALERLAAEEPEDTPDLQVEPVGEWTWAERLWVVPAERRLGVKEATEARGRSRSSMYVLMATDRGPARLPHRKLDGQVLFLAGELRAWIRDHEEVIHAGPIESTREERRGRLEVA